MAFKINWDNGSHACGTFPMTVESEETAEEFGENWLMEMSGLDDPSDAEEVGYSYEVIEVEDEADTEGEGWDPIGEQSQAGLNCGRP